MALLRTEVFVKLIGFALFLAVGLLGAFWARAVQAYESRIATFNPFFQEYVASEIYLWQIRLVGAICLLVAGALIYPVIA